jgi:hypothetical protein
LGTEEDREEDQGGENKEGGSLIQLNVTQLWALVAGGPIAMVLTVLVGILINNAVGKSNMAGLKSEIQRVEGILTSELKRAEGELKSEVKRIEGELKSELKRIEGVLGAKIDALTVRIKALEDEIHSPLVKR